MEQQTLSLPDLSTQTHGLHAVSGRHAAAHQLLTLCAQLALKAPVHILDCGNRSDMYTVARELRPLTRDPAAALNRIELSRAFTCYQCETLLSNNRCLTNTTVLVLDLLATYLDESVSVREAERLLVDSIDHLVKMSRMNYVVVSLSPLDRIAEEARRGLFFRLRDAVDSCYEIVPASVAIPAEHDAQLTLF